MESQNNNQEKEAIQDLAKTLVNIAKEEGDRFRKENGREPTESEAGEIADMIKRQFQIAIAMRKH